MSIWNAVSLSSTLAKRKVGIWHRERSPWHRSFMMCYYIDMKTAILISLGFSGIDTGAEKRINSENEMIFIPQKVADRLREYVDTRKIGLQEKDIPNLLWGSQIDCAKGWSIGWNPSEATWSPATCCDICKSFRCATWNCEHYVLRHSNLSTTQIYLGRISDTEALKWIETIYS